jgi:archaellum component FlaC
MEEPDLDVPVSAQEGDVTVEKSFAADRFPVPAITFTITFTGDDPVNLRLVDEIPDSFSMEGIGFHPDFESEHWTAYRDHRVEFVRTLAPGATVETVYGIRIDSPDDAREFLGTPTVELLDEGESDRAEAESVLGRDTTQVVRDALAGERGMAALDDDSPLSSPDEPRPEPRALTSETVSVVSRRDESTVDAGDAEPDASETDAGASDHAVEANESEAEASATELSDMEDEDPETVEEELDVESNDAPDGARETGATATGAAAPESEALVEEAPASPSEPDGVAAALAAEIRAGDVAQEDLELLREELDFGAPKSVDVRIGRLQSQVEDVIAYRDALAEFLDDQGTADELLDDFRGDLDSLESRLADVDASLSAAATERTDLADDVSAMRETVDDVESEVASLDQEMGEVREDIASIDERLVEVEDAVQSELDEVRSELEDLQEFRDRLSSAFGPE